MNSTKNKICKICNIEKSITEFHAKGKGYYDTKCKVCSWFISNKNYILKKEWSIFEYKFIIDNLLNKKIILLNDIAENLSKDLKDLCNVVSNYLKLNGKIPLKIKYFCDNCKTEIILNPSSFLTYESHFCCKKCNDEFKKGINYHKIIGENICLSCNNKFNIYSNVPDQKFCSIKCKQNYYTDNNLNKSETSCANCNKTILKNKSQINKYNNNYCSLKCEKEFKYKQSHETRFCEFCNNPFECLKTDKLRFCSRECQGKWQSKVLIGVNANGYNHNFSEEDRTIKCEWCEKDFKTTPSQINKVKFCSEECRRNWYSKVYSQTEERRLQSQNQIIKMLSSGVFNTNTDIQLITNDILDSIGIHYINEKEFKYCTVDNYLDDYNLIIEVMGTYWHTDNRFYSKINYGMQVNRIRMDKIKHTNIKKDYDIEILYLWEYDIKNNKDLCIELIKKYINNKGILENYHSFNYKYINNYLELNDNIIIPYMYWNIENLKDVIDITVKEKMSKKQIDKWITFNCEVCGKEREELIVHYNKNKHHFCSINCHNQAQRKII